jgi:uncharacterized protein (TIGR03083 family)
MDRRPLRQFYDHDRTFALDGLPAPAATFAAHRRRFVAALEGLDEEAWSRTTQCDAWNGRDVVNHLVSADGFWVLTLGGRGRATPTTFLRDFDPTTSPDQVIAGAKTRSSGEVLEAFRASTDTLVEALAAVGDDDWTLVSESPFGHVPVQVIAAHSLWDSWLHERDVLLPLGHDVAVERDELVTAAAFTLFVAGAQGGVLDDPEAVGEGPSRALAAALSFDDLPGEVLTVAVDRDVRVAVAADAEVAAGPSAVTGAGRALDLVEAGTGRADAEPVLARLPDDLAAQLRRARRIL